MSAKDNAIIPMEWFSIFSILMLVGLVYSSTVTNSFNGDDFVHLQWLHQAVSQPELIWRNFHSSWLDLTTAKFYRPLISIFMLADYVVWRGNGIGFHLTNLFCHLANTLFVWLVLRSIIAGQYVARSLNHYIWCLSAAAMFGLYPLHPEAVAWITGRVDLFVTFFFLVAFYGYLRWRQSNEHQWLYLSLLSFICSLLSKEMAIMLPAVISWYELILAFNQLDSSIGENKAIADWGNIKTAIISVCRQTSLFWLILVSYILWRAYSLGTLVGGYDSTVSPLQNWRLLVYLWKHSLYMLFIPFNQSLLTSGKSIIIFWVALLLLSLLLCIKYVLLDKEIFKTNRAVFVFLCGWLVLSLLPVIKLFNIGTDLQGSRLAYLATVPLSILICFGLSHAKRRNNKIAYWQIGALSLVLSAAGAGLLINNTAWAKAAAASQALEQQLNDLSEIIPANTVVYIVGLPDQINGAYVCRNALDGMTKYPQITKDIHNCFNLNAIDNIFPFGYALHSMTAGTSTDPLPQFYVWRPAQLKLQRFNLPTCSAIPLEKIWSGKNLETDLSAYITNKSCINVDFLTIDSDSANIKDQIQNRPYLAYKNDLHPEETSISALPTCRKGRMIFLLHGLVDWTLGGKCSEIELHLPQAAVNSVAIVPANKIMPTLSFKPAANQYIVGYIELDKLHPSCQLYYDVTKIAEAKNVVLESAPPNQTFAIESDPSSPSCPSKRVNMILPCKKLSGRSGQVLLTKADFPETGIYALRLRAVSEDNRYIGVAGDHIIVTVK